MRKPIIRLCRCCGEKFSTTKLCKYYVDITHQKPHNNFIQNTKRSVFSEFTKEHYKTYQIFNELLNEKSKIVKSKDFLRGTGAKLGVFSHVENFEGENTTVLFDIAIIPNENNIILKRKQHA